MEAAIRPISHPKPKLSSRSEEHTSELQSHSDLVCRLLLEKKTRHSTTLLTQRPRMPSTSCTNTLVWPRISSSLWTASKPAQSAWHNTESVTSLDSCQCHC